VALHTRPVGGVYGLAAGLRPDFVVATTEAGHGPAGKARADLWQGASDAAVDLQEPTAKVLGRFLGRTPAPDEEHVVGLVVHLEFLAEGPPIAHDGDRAVRKLGGGGTMAAQAFIVEPGDDLGIRHCRLQALKDTTGGDGHQLDCCEIRVAKDIMVYPVQSSLGASMDASPAGFGLPTVTCFRSLTYLD
jgi:hypothetical protein